MAAQAGTDDAPAKPRPPQPGVKTDAPLSASAFDQTNVDVAAVKNFVYVAWEERGMIRTTFSRDGGRRFQPPRTRGAGTAPSVSVGRGRSLWLAFARSDGKVVVAEGAGRPQAVAPRGGTQSQIDITALDSDGAYAAWIDDQTGLAGTYGAIVGDVPERLDQGDPAPSIEGLDNARSPSVNADGKQLLATWSDFRAGRWDVYSRTSEDRGESFAPQIRMTSVPEGQPSDADAPQASVLRGDPFVAWMESRAAVGAPPAFDVIGARPAQAVQRLDGDAGTTFDAVAPAAVELPSGQVALAWESRRAATPDIAVRAVTTGARRRADSAGTRAVTSARPSIASLGKGKVLVAWEDDRDGPSNVYYRRLVLP